MFYKYYDKIYSEKNYSEEVDFILSLVDEPKTVLDIGCGTGNHTMQFLKRGIDSFGIDSESKMIEIALTKDKCFLCCNVYDINSKFDLTIAMFNVINYISDLESLVRFFKTVKKLTSDTFIFDCWNGLAVILDNPKKVTKKVENIKISIEPNIFIMDQVVRIKNIICVDNIKFEYVYSQTLWTPKILKDILNMSGFKSVKIYEWMTNKIATEKIWKIMVVCK